MNIFLDCGFYIGQIINEYRDRGEIDTSWELYAFEPNEELDVRAWLEKVGFPDGRWLREAVWTEDGEVDFWVSQRHNASYVDGMSLNAPDHKITVPSIDFSRFVRELPEADKIICSMDIEGAEFPVLDKMIAENTIDRIDILDIEFHNRITGTPAEKTHELYDEITSRGVEIRLKIPVEGRPDAIMSNPENWK